MIGAGDPLLDAPGTDDGGGRLLEGPALGVGELVGRAGAPGLEASPPAPESVGPVAQPTIHGASRIATSATVRTLISVWTRGRDTSFHGHRLPVITGMVIR